MLKIELPSVQFSSVVSQSQPISIESQSCLTLFDPTDCNTPSFPVYHRLNGHEFEWSPGVSDGQGGLVCCSPWGCKELDMTEQLK